MIPVALSVSFPAKNGSSLPTQGSGAIEQWGGAASFLPAVAVNHRPLRILALLTAIATTCELPAAVRRASSLEELQELLNDAQPGDRLVLAEGSYSASSPLKVDRAGTAASPIVIAAETVGGVEIRGQGSFHVIAPASHIHLEGFVFLHQKAVRFGVGTQFCRITRNVFENAGVTHYLMVDGDDTEVSYNEFRNKSTVGQMLKIGGAPTRPAERTWVHHNYFHDFTNVGTNGGETIQVAVGENSMRSAFSRIEFNLFERCNGENELISNKSCDNVYHANTFRDSPQGELTLRDGDRITVSGNFFLNTRGLRIFGDNTNVFNNYFEGCTVAIVVGCGTDADHILGQPFKAYDRVDNLRLVHNTLVNNRKHIEFQAREKGMPAQSAVIANNLIVGDAGSLVVFGAAPHNTTWKSNLLWGDAVDGDAPREGFRRADPRLAPCEPLLRLGPGSSAVDAAADGFAEVVQDLDGQTRDGPKDIGADEYQDGPVMNRPLLPRDVGPRARASTGL